MNVEKEDVVWTSVHDHVNPRQLAFETKQQNKIPSFSLCKLVNRLFTVQFLASLLSGKIDVEVSTMFAGNIYIVYR